MSKSSKFSYFPTLIIVGLATLALAQSTSPWSLKKDKNGIQIYTRAVQGSQLKEYKAIVNIRTDVASAQALILDFPSYTEWQHNCSDSKLLKKNNENDLYSYNLTDAPWPVSDRETIVRTEVSKNGEVVILQMTATPDMIPKKKGVVRVPAMNGFWQLTPKEGGITEVMQQVHADPGGSIPDWLANSAVVDTPYNTLLNMRKRLEQ